MTFLARLQGELRQLELDPPPGIATWPKDEMNITELEATIRGTEDTPYAGGLFRLRISIPQRYPFEPPSARFITPIYHPNIDSGGRICLNTLHMPPKGVWTPALNIAALLKTIQLLMNAPNADDGLVIDITEQFKRDPSTFEATAKAWTRQHAMLNSVAVATQDGGDDDVNTTTRTRQQHGVDSISTTASTTTTTTTTVSSESAANVRQSNAFDDDDSGEEQTLVSNNNIVSKVVDDDGDDDDGDVAPNKKARHQE